MNNPQLPPQIKCLHRCMCAASASLCWWTPSSRVGQQVNGDGLHAVQKNHTGRRIYVCIVDEAQASSGLCHSPSILLVLM